MLILFQFHYVLSLINLVSGIFPDDWKCARVTPLFKQGEPSGHSIKSGLDPGLDSGPSTLDSGLWTLN